MIPTAATPISAVMESAGSRPPPSPRPERGNKTRGTVMVAKAARPPEDRQDGELSRLRRREQSVREEEILVLDHDESQKGARRSTWLHSRWRWARRLPEGSRVLGPAPAGWTAASPQRNVTPRDFERGVTADGHRQGTTDGPDGHDQHKPEREADGRFHQQARDKLRPLVPPVQTAPIEGQRSDRRPGETEHNDHGYRQAEGGSHPGRGCDESHSRDDASPPQQWPSPCGSSGCQRRRRADGEPGHAQHEVQGKKGGQLRKRPGRQQPGQEKRKRHVPDACADLAAGHDHLVPGSLGGRGRPAADPLCDVGHEVPIGVEEARGNAPSESASSERPPERRIRKRRKPSSAMAICSLMSAGAGLGPRIDFVT